MGKPLVKPWRHYRDAEKNLYLVIDVPHELTGIVVLMLVREYRPDEENDVQRIPYSDWVTFTEEEKSLIPCTPKLI